jgi:hypothetical protein
MCKSVLTLKPYCGERTQDNRGENYESICETPQSTPNNKHVITTNMFPDETTGVRTGALRSKAYVIMLLRTKY